MNVLLILEALTVSALPNPQVGLGLQPPGLPSHPSMDSGHHSAIGTRKIKIYQSLLCSDLCWPMLSIMLYSYTENTESIIKKTMGQQILSPRTPTSLAKKNNPFYVNYFILVSPLWSPSFEIVYDQV